MIKSLTVYKCKECNSNIYPQQPCTICGCYDKARMYLQFAFVTKRYLICGDCWVNRLEPTMKFLRKNKTKDLRKAFKNATAN